jgi:hypothetical protein
MDIWVGLPGTFYLAAMILWLFSLSAGHFVLSFISGGHPVNKMSPPSVCRSLKTAAALQRLSDARVLWVLKSVMAGR